MFDRSNDKALTVVSLTNDVPPKPERRDDFRNLSILKAAVLRSAFGEELCMVRNISRGGLMAHIFSELDVRDVVKIEFRSGATVRGRVVWRQPGLMGVKFIQPIDVADILTEPAQRFGYVSRAPRITISATARLQSGSLQQVATLCNISQGGAGVFLSQPEAIDREAVLSVSGLPVLTGSVRWQSGAFAGIAFRDLIAFEEVGQWICVQNAGGYPPLSSR